MVEPITGSPTFFCTGMLSPEGTLSAEGKPMLNGEPVIMASLTAEAPKTTTPSTGTRAPLRTRSQRSRISQHRTGQHGGRPDAPDDLDSVADLQHVHGHLLLAEHRAAGVDLDQRGSVHLRGRAVGG